MTAKERDLLAAELVLGTLPDRERAEARMLVASDPTFARLVRDWEDRLAPLDAGTRPVTPSPQLKDRLMTALSVDIAVAPGDRAPDVRLDRLDRPTPAVAIDPAVAPAGDGMGPMGEVIDLTRRLTRWRRFAGLTTALAAGLAAVIFVDRYQLIAPPPTTAGQYVAVVNRDASLPALLVNVDMAKGEVTVRQVAATQPLDRSLELWVIPDGEKPRSLGLIEPTSGVIRISATKTGSFDPKAVFAVTEEPKGGSPDGSPTGPVVYSGKMIPAEP